MNDIFKNLVFGINIDGLNMDQAFEVVIDRLFAVDRIQETNDAAVILAFEIIDYLRLNN